MTDLVDLSLPPAVAGLLDRWGYSAAHPALREVAPTATRGHNLVLAWPPAARYAVPACAALLTRLVPGSGLGLVLAPPHALEEWAAAVFPLARAAGLAALAAARPARPARLLREGGLDLLITDPETALELLSRSALKLERVTWLLLAWPEFFIAEQLTAVMQDLPRDTQRVLHLAEPPAQHELVERYAWRALISGPLARMEAGPAGAGLPSVRTVAVSWSGRAAALRGLLEVLDPAEAVLWAADAESANQADRELAERGVAITTGEAPSTRLVIAWDLPPPERLDQLSRAGEVVLLVPVHGAGYVARVTGKQQPLRLPGALEQARGQAAARRQAIERTLEGEDLSSDLIALAPLFERHDPARVAAALYRLGSQTGAGVSTGPGAGAGPAPAPTTAQVWIGVGRKDEASANDIVAALTREIGVDRRQIGRIEIRDLYSLVELPAPDAEDICRRLTGRTIRKRRVVARLDRK
jgi:ATP-dependent RNA helicase DeaD